MKYGFVNVAAAVPAVKVADTAYNVFEIEKIIADAEGRGVEILCFPELCITGYTCQDLFRQQLLLTQAEEGLVTLLAFTRQLIFDSCITGSNPVTPTNITWTIQGYFLHVVRVPQ